MLLAKNVTTDQYVAVKVPIAGISAKKFYNLMTKEINFQRNLVHTNVIRLLDHGFKVLELEGQPTEVVSFLAFEIATGGELFDYALHTEAFSEKVARYFFL